MKNSATPLLRNHSEIGLNDAAVVERHPFYSGAMQLLKAKENTIDILRNELELGERSMMIENFNPQNHLIKLHAHYT